MISSDLLPALSTMFTTLNVISPSSASVVSSIFNLAVYTCGYSAFFPIEYITSSLATSNTFLPLK